MSTRTKFKTAVVLMNMGGPTDSSGVYPFLRNLFSDRDLIPLPFQKYASKFISKRRTPKVIQQYNEIGGGSPITMHTTAQAYQLCTLLDKRCPDSGIIIFCYVLNSLL